MGNKQQTGAQKQKGSERGEFVANNMFFACTKTIRKSRQSVQAPAMQHQLQHSDLDISRDG